MEHTINPERLTVLGIDPGRNTGLYSASIPKLDRALTLDEFQREGRWLGNAVVALSSSKAMSLTEKWGHMAQRLEDAIMDVDPALIVIEYPADGMPKWSGGTARGIDFSMGMFFGFAVLAIDPRINTNIALVPVTSSRAKNREGWMPRITETIRGRKCTHTQNRERTLIQCRDIAARLFANEQHRDPSRVKELNDHVYSLSDHELMALGALTYYITHRAPADWGKEWKSETKQQKKSESLSTRSKSPRTHSTSQSSERSKTPISILALARQPSDREGSRSVLDIARSSR